MWRRKKVRWFWNNRVSGHFMHSVFYLPPFLFQMFRYRPISILFNPKRSAFSLTITILTILTITILTIQWFSKSIARLAAFGQVLMNFRINELDQMLYGTYFTFWQFFFALNFLLLIFFFWTIIFFLRSAHPFSLSDEDLKRFIELLVK